MNDRTWDQIRQALKVCNEDTHEEETHYINKACYEKGLEIVGYMEKLSFPVPKFFTVCGEAIVFEWNEDEETSIFKQRDKSKALALLTVTEDEPPKTNVFSLMFR